MSSKVPDVWSPDLLERFANTVGRRNLYAFDSMILSAEASYRIAALRVEEAKKVAKLRQNGQKELDETICEMEEAKKELEDVKKKRNLLMAMDKAEFLASPLFQKKRKADAEEDNEANRGIRKVERKIV